MQNAYKHSQNQPVVEVVTLLDLIIERRGNKMIQISKDEARLVRKHLPGISIKRTVNKFYVEEDQRVIELIKRFSAFKVVNSYC